MELLIYLAAILLMPLIPAYILYKTLPAKTTVKGPFKGLTVNLSGAFSGYFLLVLITLGFCIMVFTSDKQKRIDELNRTTDSLTAALGNSQSSFSTWSMEGKLMATDPEKTKIFYDNNDTKVSPAGDFISSLSVKNTGDQEKLPLWICLFNPSDGFGVIRLNPAISNDIQEYNISIDTVRRTIKIGKPVALQKNK